MKKKPHQLRGGCFLFFTIFTETVEILARSMSLKGQKLLSRNKYKPFDLRVFAFCPQRAMLLTSKQTAHRGKVL